jgi:hypothetical protein
VFPREPGVDRLWKRYSFRTVSSTRSLSCWRRQATFSAAFEYLRKGKIPVLPHTCAPQGRRSGLPKPRATPWVKGPATSIPSPNGAQ